MPPITPKPDNFAIEIDFEPGTSSDPARVFKATSELIDAMGVIDREIIKSVDSKIEPVLTLEDIETGSLRTWLRIQVDKVSDDVLKDGDWKKIIGSYLIRAKHIIVKWLDGKAQITSLKDVEELEAALLQAAKDTDVRHIPAYQPIRRKNLLDGIQEISNALAHLEQPDSASFITSEGSIDFNLDFRISTEKINELTVEESISHDEQMILKIKKPDFLGESKWEFVFEHAIFAKIEHTEWLKRFQEGEEPLYPGDSIRALVHVEVKYGFEHEVVSREYKITKVLEVLHRERPEQRLLGE